MKPKADPENTPCPKCGTIMEHKVENQRDEGIITLYHTWTCPKCGYIRSFDEH